MSSFRKEGGGKDAGEDVISTKEITSSINSGGYICPNLSTILLSARAERRMSIPPVSALKRTNGSSAEGAGPPAAAAPVVNKNKKQKNKKDKYVLWFDETDIKDIELVGGKNA
ncbi:hypothetical protein KJ912_02055, partial [Patescibacteria group bacterium]|nr:hypothetical protein [Patescibacteria group bacterium]